jgi:hypothetical protein
MNKLLQAISSALPDGFRPVDLAASGERLTDFPCGIDFPVSQMTHWTSKLACHQQAGLPVCPTGATPIHARAFSVSV